MTSILVAIPERPSNPDALKTQTKLLSWRLEEANPDLDLDVQIVRTPIHIPDASPIYTRHAVVRNHVIDTRLRNKHDFVLWIDSDLCDYPADIPSLLLETNELLIRDGKVEHGAIVAPVVTLDKHGDRFYDIGGFIEGGKRANLYPPWFSQEGPLVELDSVGCLYLIPAWLYKAGIRYAPPPLGLYYEQDNRLCAYVVEHYSVMQGARAQGVRVFARTDIRAVHAFLPDYGLEIN